MADMKKQHVGLEMRISKLRSALVNGTETSGVFWRESALSEDDNMALQENCGSDQLKKYERQETENVEMRLKIRKLEDALESEWRRGHGACIYRSDTRCPDEDWHVSVKWSDFWSKFSKETKYE